MSVHAFFSEITSIQEQLGVYISNGKIPACRDAVESFACLLNSLMIINDKRDEQALDNFVGIVNNLGDPSANPSRYDAIMVSLVSILTRCTNAAIDSSDAAFAQLIKSFVQAIASYFDRKMLGEFINEITEMSYVLKASIITALSFVETPLRVFKRQCQDLSDRLSSALLASQDFVSLTLPLLNQLTIELLTPHSSAKQENQQVEISVKEYFALYPSLLETKQCSTTNLLALYTCIAHLEKLGTVALQSEEADKFKGFIASHDSDPQHHNSTIGSKLGRCLEKIIPGAFQEVIALGNCILKEHQSDLVADGDTAINQVIFDFSQHLDALLCSLNKKLPELLKNLTANQAYLSTAKSATGSDASNSLTKAKKHISSYLTSRLTWLSTTIPASEQEIAAGPAISRQKNFRAHFPYIFAFQSTPIAAPEQNESIQDSAMTTDPAPAELSDAPKQDEPIQDPGITKYIENIKATIKQDAEPYLTKNVEPYLTNSASLAPATKHGPNAILWCLAGLALLILVPLTCLYPVVAGVIILSMAVLGVVYAINKALLSPDNSSAPAHSTPSQLA